MNSKRITKKNSGKGLAIIALILGASGLFMGIFSYLQVQTTKEMGIIVGYWESLERDISNPDHNLNYNWLIEVDDMQIMNAKYVELNQTTQFENTRFHLLKIGWYRIDVITLLISLTASAVYSIQAWENSAINIYAEYFRNADTNQVVNTKFYIYNNGSDYFEINAYCLGGMDFDITAIQTYNQLMITFVG